MSFNFKEEAAALVSKMTLEEKVAQMLHDAPAVPRLDIPSYNWWSEALHGVARAGTATMFPQAIGLAAAFDEKLLGEIASVISDEARAKYNAFQEEGDHDIYKGLTFWSPNINIFRDPRWGRGHETYGEDPWLTSVLGASFIKGLQGDDPESLKVAACAKHFAVHSGPEAERHEFNAITDEYDLWNTYLPAFEKAVKEAGVESVMGAYNRTLGDPCCGSELLLVDILRKKWGFDGHVVSDCWAVRDFYLHHMVTATAAESVALAVKMGCDLNCGNLYGYCLDAIRDGILTEEDIDKSLTRLFVTRMKLGLLGAPENPAYTSIPYEKLDCPEHRELNLSVAKKCLVLLKNDGALPLDASSLKTIGVIGPNADSRRALEGNYQGTASDYVTVLQGVREYAEKEGARILYAKGCHLCDEKDSALSRADNKAAEAVSVAKRSDAVILCLGLDADLEGEEGDTGNQFAAGDKLTLNLPAPQQRLLESVTKAAAGKPVILVLISGSALSVTWADENVGAVMQAFYPGSQGGKAIASALFGEFSPEGKLPVTFYRSDEDLPDFKDYSMKNRTYRYFEGKPLYPFGFGLGYSKFELSDFEASVGKCSLTVKNAGKIPAGETLQLYVESSAVKEKRELRGIAKVFLNPGETARFDIEVPSKAFSRYDKNGDLVRIPGEYILSAGFSQPDDLSVKLCGVKPLSAAITIK